MKLTNFHIVVSSMAAIAGVAIAAYQTFLPGSGSQNPVNVVVALEPPKADASVPDTVVEKQDAIPAIATEATDLGQGATITAALKDGSENRYNLSSLFDGANDTFIAINSPDEELNILVTFKGNTSRPVTAIEYIPPAGVDPTRLATTVDIIVLPDGQLEASGRPVISFSLPQSSEKHTYAIPGRAEGKGLWLRISGDVSAGKSFVGDFRILSEGLAP